MPTQTFFNLPEEKQHRLIRAARDEFSRVPFDRASINQIVQAAGVSRGSFYQYFESKEDVLRYILSGFRQKALAQARKSLTDSGGDLFAMFRHIFDYTISHAAGEINLDFCRNLFTDQGLVNRVFSQGGTGCKLDAFAAMAREISPFVDRERLAAGTEDDLAQMLGVLWLVTGNALARAFLEPSLRDTVRAQFLRRMELVKDGFARRP